MLTISEKYSCNGTLDAAVPTGLSHVIMIVTANLYREWAFLMIFTWNSLGQYIGFMNARLCSHSGLAVKCICCESKNGNSSKMKRFAMASLTAVENEPWRTVFLLSFGPAPTYCICYTLGGFAKKLPSWKFICAYCWGNLAWFPQIYLALSARDVAVLLSSGDFAGDPTQIATTVVSCIVGILVAAIISRKALRELHLAQERCPPAVVANTEEPMEEEAAPIDQVIAKDVDHTPETWQPATVGEPETVDTLE